MSVETIYTLAASNITISGGGQLSGVTQGNGSHLDGLTITLENNDWAEIDISDNDDSFTDNDTSQILDGAQTYDGSSYANGLRVEPEYSLTLEDPSGNIYRVFAFNINEPGATSYSTVEGLAFEGGAGGFPPVGVPLTVINSTEYPTTPYADLATPICFTHGTMIATSNGLRPIESLVAGDMIETLNDGVQAIRWIGSTRLSQTALQTKPAFFPVRIMAGALGQGLPHKDLRVSRQHRLLVSSRIVERVFGITDVLIPAHKLTILPGIDVDQDINGIEYFHILFDCHQVVFAEGAPTESLYTGPEALKAVSKESRAEILALFPLLEKMDYTSPSALPIVAGKKLTRLLDRHIKNDKPLLETYEPSPNSLL